MTSKLFSLIFLACLTFGSSAAGDIMDCRYNPDYPTMQNFDVDRIIGKWYNMKKGTPTEMSLPDDFENTQNCYTLDYTRNPESSYFLDGNNKYVNSTGDTTDSNGLTTINRDNPAWWNSFFKVNEQISVQNYVKWIAGDYDNWAVHVVCGPFEDADIFFFQVLTRTRTPDPALISSIDALLESLGVPKDHMTILDHTDCPFD